MLTGVTRVDLLDSARSLVLKSLDQISPALLEDRAVQSSLAAGLGGPAFAPLLAAIRRKNRPWKRNVHRYGR